MVQARPFAVAVRLFLPLELRHFVTAWGASHVGRQSVLLGGSLQVQVVSHSGESKPILQVQDRTWRDRRVQSLPCC